MWVPSFFIWPIWVLTLSKYLQSAFCVVVVIETPRDERLAGRFKAERLLVLGDDDPGNLCLPLAQNCAHAKECCKH